MEKLTRSGSTTLILRPNDPAAARWVAIPPIVDLVPADDGRSCLATPNQVGATTVKAIGGDRMAIAYFALAIDEDEPKPAELPRAPVAAEASTSAPE